MSSKRTVWRVLPFAVLLGVFSCTDTPTAEGPANPNPSQHPGAFFVSAPAPGFAAHQWRDSREAPMTVTRTIGAEGGVIEFRDLGARIVIPEGALSGMQTIEARAVAGSVVAFEFSPHDIAFDVPVQIRIDARMLAPGWSGSLENSLDLDEHNRRMVRRRLTKLIGVYYGKSQYTGSEAEGLMPLETLPMYFEGRDVVLEVNHFCGYAVASG